MDITNAVAPACSAGSFAAFLSFSPPVSRTPPRTRQFSLSAEDSILIEAWAQVSRLVTGCVTGPREDGGDCVVLTIAQATPDSEANARWLVCAEWGCITAKHIGAPCSVATYPTAEEALQSLAPLSPVERRSARLIADAMLLARTSLLACLGAH